MKNKTFKNNKNYFEFHNKMKNIINIVSIKLLKGKIKIAYEDKKG